MSKPLVICMVTNNYIPYSGGVVSSIQASAHSLRQRGHRVIIVTLDFLDHYNIDELDVVRVKCPFRFTYNNNYMAIPWRPNKYVLEIIKEYKPHLIHIHHPFLLGLSGLRAAQKLKIPAFFTYHTIYEQFLHHVPLPQFLTRPVTQKVVKAFCQKIDHIIVPSKSILDIIKKERISAQAHILSSGILPIFKKNKFTYKKTGIGFNLLTVSRFTQEKNIPFLLKMFSCLDQDQFRFTLIGYGPDLEKLKSYAYDDLKLSKDNLRFVVKPEKHVLVDAYDKADLFIFASTTETQGIVLAESMARGTPIIARYGTGIIDIIKNNSNGFIIHNIDEMYKAIIKIFHNIELFQQLQYNAWLTGQKYTSECYASKLETLYKKSLEIFKSYQID